MGELPLQGAIQESFTRRLCVSTTRRFLGCSGSSAVGEGLPVYYMQNETQLPVTSLIDRTVKWIDYQPTSIDRQLSSPPPTYSNDIYILPVVTLTLFQYLPVYSSVSISLVLVMNVVFSLFFIITKYNKGLTLL